MPELKPGDKAPDFTAPTDGGGQLTLSSLEGEKIVLYFYPKDDTPGCTSEACGFNDMLAQFKKLNARIIGVSRCDTKKHDKFKNKYGLNFTLVTDETGEICEAYGTWGEKTLYGRKYRGIERATFLIDENGKIAATWRNVKVPGHVEAVKDVIEELAEKAA